MEKLEGFDHLAGQAHLAARLCRICTDQVMAAKLGELAREFAAKAINLGASPESFLDIPLAAGR
jgi:hypothetical protein